MEKNRVLVLLTVSILSLIPTLIWAQFDWVPFDGNPVIDENFDLGSIQIARPSVVFDGSTYHLWYGNRRAVSNLELDFMGYATSPDGENWTLVDPEVIAPSMDNNRFDQLEASQGWVIAEGDSFKMWYWGFNPNFGQFGINSIGLATSTDGVNWTPVAGPGMFGAVYDAVMDGRPDGEGLATPSVVKDGQTYHMWYSRVKATTLLSRIAYARSSDGINWSNVPGSGRDGAVLDWGSAGSFDEITVSWPAVMKTDEGFIMWYVGVDQTGTSRLGCAISTDSVEWQRVSGNGTKGACFDVAHTVSVIKQDGLFKMWYGIFDADVVNLAFSGIADAVEEISDDIHPKSFSLQQNYPNPFNPGTTIPYQLSKSAHVTIRIYSLLGQEVQTLVDEVKQPGIYKIEWDGKNRQGQTVSTGLYVIRMEAGEFTKSKKIVLLK